MKLAVIGTGNMGGAIARGLIASGSWQVGDLICTAKTDSGIARIQATLPGVQATRDNRQAAAEADIILLALRRCVAVLDRWVLKLVGFCWMK